MSCFFGEAVCLRFYGRGGGNGSSVFAARRAVRMAPCHISMSSRGGHQVDHLGMNCGGAFFSAQEGTSGFFKREGSRQRPNPILAARGKFKHWSAAV